MDFGSQGSRTGLTNINGIQFRRYNSQIQTAIVKTFELIYFYQTIICCISLFFLHVSIFFFD